MRKYGCKSRATAIAVILSVSRNAHLLTYVLYFRVMESATKKTLRSGVFFVVFSSRTDGKYFFERMMKKNTLIQSQQKNKKTKEYKK